MTPEQEQRALEPCPFCGGKAEHGNNVLGPPFAGCWECHMFCHPEAWNLRAESPLDAARLRVVEAAKGEVALYRDESTPNLVEAVDALEALEREKP